MNFRQKLVYAMFGALLALAGVLFGSIISPPLIAQNNGVFDTVVCKGLSVVDKAGNPRIMLGMGEHSSIGILNETGKIVAYLADHKNGSILMLNLPSGESAVGFVSHDVVGNDIRVYNTAGKVIWQPPLNRKGE